MHRLGFIKYFVLLFATVAAQQICRTPNQSRGLCVPYNRCSYVLEYLVNYGDKLPNNIKDYFQKSKCNGPTEEVHVCCDGKYITGATPAPTNNYAVTASPPTKSTTTRSTSMMDYESNLNAEGVEILKNTVCGVGGSTLVRGGVEVKLQEFPWMALLQYNTQEMPFKCGGSLITNRYVLTAAHCLTDLIFELVNVRLGEHNLDTDMDCKSVGDELKCNPPVENYGIAKTIWHPEYSKNYKINDVGLIKLDRTVNFQKHIKPICLPITQASTEIKKGQRYLIAGWGTTEHGETSKVLLKANVPYKEPQICQDIFKIRIRITERHICAGGENQIDTCKGDSGGPLFFPASYRGNARFVQTGVVSVGAPGCSGNETFPGIYAFVPEMMPWITENIIA